MLYYHFYRQIDEQFAEIAASKANRPENFAYNYSTYNTFDDVSIIPPIISLILIDWSID